MVDIIIIIIIIIFIIIIIIIIIVPSRVFPSVLTDFFKLNFEWQ